MRHHVGEPSPRPNSEPTTLERGTKWDPRQQEDQRRLSTDRRRTLSHATKRDRDKAAFEML